MMRVKRLGIVMGLGAAVLATPAVRAQDAPVRLTLDAAIARGLEASHRLAAMTARADASEARVRGREAAVRPQVSVLGGYTRTNHIDAFGIALPSGAFNVIYPDVPDNYRARLDLAWPIYTAGRADALERAAKAEAAAAVGERDATREDLRLEITRAYWALVTARATVGVLEDGLRLADAHLTDVKNRQAVGLVPPNDVLSAEAARAREQVQLIDARNRADAAATDLRRLVGLRPDTPVEPEQALTPASAPAEPVPALVEAAKAARPDRLAIARHIDAAAAVREASAAAARPQIAVTGGVDYARPNPRIFPRAAEFNSSWDVGVNGLVVRLGRRARGGRRRRGAAPTSARPASSCSTSTRASTPTCASGAWTCRRASPPSTPPRSACARRPRRTAS